MISVSELDAGVTGEDGNPGEGMGNGVETEGVDIYKLTEPGLSVR